MYCVLRLQWRVDPVTTSAKTKPRKRTELRPTTIKRYPTAAAGSVMMEQGKTKVLCTASISASPPKWLPKDDEGNYKSGC